MSRQKYDRCEKCKKPIKPGTAVALELSFKTGKWYKPGECPTVESQGCFNFGPDCGPRVLLESSVTNIRVVA